MTINAEMICYVQPVVTAVRDAGVAWVDTSKTAVVRGMVASKSEAVAVIEDARRIAIAIGEDVVIKKIVRAIPGARRPAGVKALQGSEVLQGKGKF